MPPDPVGTRPSVAPDFVSIVDDSVPPDWYDRSSLRGDFLVMIADQSEADFLRRAPEKQFCEFIDGVVFMPPRVHTTHQSDVNFLLFLITYYHAFRPVGLIYSGPAAIKLREGCWLEPDLFLMPENAQRQLLEDGFGRPPVLLVVEVLSPSNREYDLETKASLYREAKVDEIWFVDRTNRVVIVERREVGGYFNERFERGPVVSRSMPGFWFDAGWLWQIPEPNIVNCANLIMAGPPPT